MNKDKRILSILVRSEKIPIGRALLRTARVVPRYIKAADLCLIPYRVSAFTAGVSPLKFYEYMAMGKPVVATALGDLLRFRDFLYVAEGAEEFCHKIKLALEEDDPRRRSQRVSFARENSWQKRLETIAETLEERIGKGSRI